MLISMICGACPQPNRPPVPRFPGCVTFPARPRIWSVSDIGEPGRISAVESEREPYREGAYQEIVKNVDRLISDISDASGQAIHFYGETP